MGLYDELRVIYETEARHYGIVCPAGHAIHKLQTKSLGQRLGQYAIANRHLYHYGEWNEPDVESHKSSSNTNTLEVERHYRFGLNGITSTVLAHGFCEACEPVYQVRETFGGLPEVTTVSPFCEFEIEIVRGEVVGAKRVRGPTREEMRIEITGRGATVLHDDDPLVQRERRERREERERMWREAQDS